MEDAMSNENIFLQEQIKALCKTLEFVNDILADLMNQSTNLSERITSTEEASGLCIGMLKGTMKEDEFEKLYCKHLGVLGGMQWDIT